ncbi:MAG: hypothetical protein FWE02_04440 [Defluviitaleaceae bacterium]|nr:hypothetical protein [Defluviitaleaceae bacterium]
MIDKISFPSNDGNKITDFKTWLNRLKITFKGMIFLNEIHTLNHFNGIIQGSKIEVNGNIYLVVRNEKAQGNIIQGQGYLYAVPQYNESIIFTHSDESPTWNAGKGGWYKNNSRAIISYHFDGTNFIDLTILDGLSPIFELFIPGKQEYTVPGTYQFTVPNRMEVLRVSGCGAGGGGANGGNSAVVNNPRSGGGAAGAAFILNYLMTVTPGQIISIVIGQGGRGGMGGSPNPQLSGDGNYGEGGGNTVFNNFVLVGGRGGGRGNAVIDNWNFFTQGGLTVNSWLIPGNAPSGGFLIPQGILQADRGDGGSGFRLNGGNSGSTLNPGWGDGNPGQSGANTERAPGGAGGAPSGRFGGAGGGGASFGNGTGGELSAMISPGFGGGGGGAVPGGIGRNGGNGYLKLEWGF